MPWWTEMVQAFCELHPEMARHMEPKMDWKDPTTWTTGLKNIFSRK
jgi:hypothetical protein